MSEMENFAMALFSSEEVSKLPKINFMTYFKLVEPLAREIEAETKIYFVVPIIQSAHESANGNSDLARKSCNLFGITATDSWIKEGNPIAEWPTSEFVKANGTWIKPKRAFRAYATWRDSFLDWSKLITGLSIYKRAYALCQDKMTVPEGLESMGHVYATDPDYAKSLKALYSQVV